MRRSNITALKAVALAALIGLCGSAVPAAAGVIVYNFEQDNCTNGCGLPSYGTVTLTDLSGGGVNVKLSLLNGSGLISTGALSGHSLEFRLSGSPAISIANLPSLWSIAGPATFSPNGGFGTFNFALDCNSACAPNNPWTTGLNFDITTSSITTASFIDGGTPQDSYFVADISNPNGGKALTGRIGASYSGFGTTEVPEPFTLSLFGAGVAGAAALRRRKKARPA